jgi:DUF4097 and DUF4098 domain-containing protein YvlB
MLARTVTLLALTVTPALAQSRATRPPSTDQTVTVSRGARLTMSDVIGEVIIRGWDRDAVRVQARHSSRTKVAINQVPSGLTITAEGSSGPPSSVDYEISVPSWLAVKIDGTFAFISADNVNAEVIAENVRGDIVVKGGSGVISCTTIEGEITIEGAKGRVKASSVHHGVTITSTTGDISAESTNGPIMLTGISSGNVDVQTINGTITFEGKALERGRYQLTSHNGSIYVSVAESSNASFTVRTYSGRVDSNLPTKGDGDPRRGRRVTYTLGNGAAEFEVETFGGSIFLRRPGTLPPPKTKRP